MEVGKHRAWSRGKDSWQKSEIRRQRSGVKLISDLRLLTSVIDDFYDFCGFYDFNEFSNFLILDLNGFKLWIFGFTTP